jgi:hypothetical protein
MVHKYKYYVCEHYTSKTPSSFYLKYECFGDWILPPSSGIETSSIDWDQLSMFHLKTETESSLRNVVCFINKNSTMDDVQKHNICKMFSVNSDERMIMNCE